MSSAIEMSCHSGLLFVANIIGMGCHSHGKTVCGLSNILDTTFLACDDVYDVLGGAGQVLSDFEIVLVGCASDCCACLHPWAVEASFTTRSISRPLFLGFVQVCIYQKVPEVFGSSVGDHWFEIFQQSLASFV